MNNKGQAALEFLMTYGWTILAAIVSIAAFAQFGLVSVEGLKSMTGATVCALPPGLACEYRIGSNGIQLAITNGFHAKIVDVTVRVISSEIGNCGPSDEVDIDVGQSKQIFVSCPNIGDAKSFKGDLEVSYRFVDQSISHTDTGTISGSVEEGTVCVDADNDGFGVGTCETAIDCDDGDPAVYPEAAPENTEITCEICQDSKDNDCDGATDGDDTQCADSCSGQQTCIDPDFDDDRYDDVVCGGNDCDDTDDQIHPGPEEEPPYSYENAGENVIMCTDGIDNDCDSLIDAELVNPDNFDNSCEGAAGCITALHDIDRDRHYAINSCIGENVDDCDDNNAARYPGLPENCLDEFDNDCNDIINDGCAPASCTGDALECFELDGKQLECLIQSNCYWDDTFQECRGTALDCENSYFNASSLCQTQQTELTCPLFEGPCTDTCQWTGEEGGGEFA